MSIHRRILSVSRFPKDFMPSQVGLNVLFDPNFCGSKNTEPPLDSTLGKQT